MGFGRGLVIAFVLTVLSLARPVLAADAGDVFTVAAVPVDATAANASAAREQARRAGERRAYAILLERPTLADARGRLPPVTDSLLNDLIAGFEVANERVSGVRYLANYTFHFRADAVRHLLRQASVPFAETRSKPVVVLAVWQGSTGAALWEDPNPWRDAWNQHPPRWGLVPFVLPYGELDDVQAIGADTALAGDQAHLQAISMRYQDADVLVTQAKLDAAPEPHSVTVKTTRYDPAGAAAAQSWDKTYAASPGESDTDLLADAVAGTAAQVEDAWKTASLINFGQTGTITVQVPLDSLKSWVAIRDRLKSTPAIQHSELVSIDQTDARVAIHYFGTQDQLSVALAQHDLGLTGTAPDWVLERRSAAAPQ